MKKYTFEIDLEKMDINIIPPKADDHINYSELTIECYLMMANIIGFLKGHNIIDDKLKEIFDKTNNEIYNNYREILNRIIEIQKKYRDASNELH